MLVDEQKEELNQYKTKYKAAVARRDTLENQMKDIKTEFQSKMKILIEKTGKLLVFELMLYFITHVFQPTLTNSL